MNSDVPFTQDILKINDVSSYIDSLCKKIKRDVHEKLRRKGVVVGISGGIDSSVTLALTVKALGRDRVIAVMLPEKDSGAESVQYSELLAEKLNITYYIENITEVLQGFKCYSRRDEAVKRVFPEYDPVQYTFKIGQNEASIETNLPSIFYLTLLDENGKEERKKLPASEFLQIVAASNFKQRTRMSMLYYYAEKNHYAVVGTANKHEINQGFFVKHGDGGVDLLPIGNLYKTQVYQLAEHLDIPKEIIHRTPTSDTYSAEQTQEEFFFQLPFQVLDLLWYAYENGYEPESVAEAVNKTPEAVRNIFNSFKRKQQTTDYLRNPPIMYDGID
jgi:NAD+ synthase